VFFGEGPYFFLAVLLPYWGPLTQAGFLRIIHFAREGVRMVEHSGRGELWGWRGVEVWEELGAYRLSVCRVGMVQ
jgi:hypothetical protein